MRAMKVLRGAVLALGVVAPIVVGAAGQAQAAAGSDLDLTKCSIVDDPVDYGDGIDWYYLVVEGASVAGLWRALVHGPDVTWAPAREEA